MKELSIEDFIEMDKILNKTYKSEDNLIAHIDENNIVTLATASGYPVYQMALKEYDDIMNYKKEDK